MPTIIAYPLVLAQLESRGMRSLYHNSGAFGFAPDMTVHAVGWVGPDDPSIREAARPLARAVAPPYERNLVAGLLRAWTETSPGPVWIMPKSHWAYELEFGNTGWLPAALSCAGVDAAVLAGRNDASAIQFEPAEAGIFARLAEEILENLQGSDFAAAWPGRPVSCTLHHHKQIWWMTTDDAVLAALHAIVPA